MWLQERAAGAERQCEQLRAALSEERRHCSEARQRASELEASFKVWLGQIKSIASKKFHCAVTLTVAGALQGLCEQAGKLKSKLAEAVAEQRKARDEAAKELAAARVAWEIRRRDELQVSSTSTQPILI